MKRMVVSFLIIFLSIFLCNPINAQENGNSDLQIRPNSFNLYIGLIEYNINYERNIWQHPDAYTNLRIGYGEAVYLRKGEGTYINSSLVHLLGKRRNSHLELNFGLKYIIRNAIIEPTFSENFILDLFAGYRYEKPNGRFMFRIGINTATYLNVGFGVKF